MKLRTLNILTLTLLVITNSCSNSKLSDKEIEDRAIAITDKLDEKNIDLFRQWNFGLRGQAEIWTKTINDTSVYSCMYLKKIDTTTIITFNNFLYSNEFPCSTKIDTSKFWKFEFKKSINEKVRIEGADHNGKDHIIGTGFSIQEVFSERNPFSKLDSLSNLKDELGVYGITYIGRLGDFIEFYVTYQDVLTYISDYSTFDPKYKDFWIKEFSKGIEVKKNWNLRKLEQPKDNG